MGKQIHEITKFASGIVATPDERDIPEDSAVASLNINPVGKAGKLEPIPDDTTYLPEGIDATDTGVLTSHELSPQLATLSYGPTDDTKSLVTFNQTKKFISIISGVEDGEFTGTDAVTRLGQLSTAFGPTDLGYLECGDAAKSTVLQEGHRAHVSFGKLNGTRSTSQPRIVQNLDRNILGNKYDDISMDDADVAPPDKYGEYFKLIGQEGTNLYGIEWCGSQIHKIDARSGDILCKSGKNFGYIRSICIDPRNPNDYIYAIGGTGNRRNGKSQLFWYKVNQLDLSIIYEGRICFPIAGEGHEAGDNIFDFDTAGSGFDNKLDKGLLQAGMQGSDNPDGDMTAGSSPSYGDQADGVDHVLSEYKINLTSEDTRKIIYHGWGCTDMIVMDDYTEFKTAGDTALQKSVKQYIYFVNGDRDLFAEQHINSADGDYGEQSADNTFHSGLDGTLPVHSNQQSEFCMNGLWFWRFQVPVHAGNVSAYSRTPALEYTPAPQWESDSYGHLSDDYDSSPDMFLAKGNTASYGVIHPAGDLRSLSASGLTDYSTQSTEGATTTQQPFENTIIYSAKNPSGWNSATAGLGQQFDNTRIFGIVSACIGKGCYYNPPPITISIPYLCLFASSTNDGNLGNDNYSISAVGIMGSISKLTEVGGATHHPNNWSFFVKNLSLADVDDQQPEEGTWPPNFTNDMDMVGWDDASGTTSAAKPIAILSPTCLREEDATRIQDIGGLGLTYRIGACTTTMEYELVGGGTHTINFPGGVQAVVFSSDGGGPVMSYTSTYFGMRQDVGRPEDSILSFAEFARDSAYGFTELDEEITGIEGGVTVVAHDSFIEGSPTAVVGGMPKLGDNSPGEKLGGEIEIQNQSAAGDINPTIKFASYSGGQLYHYMYSAAAEIILNNVDFIKEGDVITGENSDDERLFVLKKFTEQKKLWVYRCYGSLCEPKTWDIGDKIALWTHGTHLMNYEFNGITEYADNRADPWWLAPYNGEQHGHVTIAPFGASVRKAVRSSKIYSQGYAKALDDGYSITPTCTSSGTFYIDADDGSSANVRNFIISPMFYATCVWYSDSKTNTMSSVSHPDVIDPGNSAGEYSYQIWGPTGTSTGDDNWYSGWVPAIYRRQNSAGDGYHADDKVDVTASGFYPASIMEMAQQYETTLVPGLGHETRQNSVRSNAVFLFENPSAERGRNLQTLAETCTTGAIGGSTTIHRYHTHCLHVTGTENVPMFIWVNGSGGDLRKYLFETNDFADGDTLDPPNDALQRCVNIMQQDHPDIVAGNQVLIRGISIASGAFDLRLRQQNSSTGSSALQINYRYYYKASFVYDNIEESPLSETIYKRGITDDMGYATMSWATGFNDIPEDAIFGSLLAVNYNHRVDAFQHRSVLNGCIMAENRSIMLFIKFNDLTKLNSRITHLRIYRAERPGTYIDTVDTAPASAYRLIKEFDLANYPYHRATGNQPNAVTDGLGKFDPGDNAWMAYEDRGDSYASYTASTGFPETMHSYTPSYNIATIGEGYKFIADCANPGLSKIRNFIFRSKALKHNVFDWSQDYTVCPEVPTAMTTYNGRLYAFSASKTFRFNITTLALEDDYDMAGCKGPTNVLTTEFGMFFADAKGIFMTTGQGIKKISDPIAYGEDIVGWQEIDHTSVKTFMVADTKRTSLLVFGGDLIYSYNISRQRWDIWQLSHASTTSNTSGIKCVTLDPLGEIMFYDGDGNLNRLATHSTDVRPATWIGRRETAGLNTQEKIWRKIKVIYDGGTAPTVAYSINNGGDWYAGTQTIEGGVVSAKVSSEHKKAKDIQLRLTSAANQNPEITSVGIIYRSKPIK